uniref:Uncharacterized protein n=1 Tax=Arundo donax TaxID=35708 RepID=A0A0A9BH16_ARUDO
MSSLQLDCTSVLPPANFVLIKFVAPQVQLY